MQNIKQEQGYSMLVTIFAVVLISVIGVSLLTINANSLKTSKNEEVDQAVYYVAESGINYHIDGVNNLLQEAFNEVNSQYMALKIEERETFDFTGTFINKAYSKIDGYITQKSGQAFTDFKYQNHDTKQAIVTISRNGNKITFESVGEIDGKTREVSQTLEMNTTNLFSTTQTVVISDPNEESTTQPGIGKLIDDKRFPNKTYVFANSFDVKGDGNGKNPEFGQGSFQNFDATKLIEGSTFDILRKTTTAPSDVPKVTATNNMTIDKSMVLNNLANISSGPYTIDASKGDITLYIPGGFDPKFNFNVIGPNKVNIVMLDGMTIPSGFQIKSTTTPKAEINLIIPNGRTANFNGGGGSTPVVIDGNILIGNSPIILDSKKIVVSGNIISLSTSDSSLNGSNNSSIGGFCAPYAKLNVNGTYELNGGNIVVNHLNINGGGSFDIKNGNTNHACGSSLFNDPSEQTYTTYEKNILSELSNLTEK